MTSPPRRLRVLVYAQHLSGVGHWVRMFELGRELAHHHAVTLVDGGRVVARSATGPRPALLPLPRLVRGGDRGLAPLDPGPASLAALLAERARLLAAQVDASPPEVLIIEHYPFSKWELEPEIGALIARVRARRPDALVLCSLRDIPRPTRHEPVDPDALARGVLARLSSFDAIVVHGEAHLTPLADHVPFAGRIAIPIHHTGYIVEPVAAAEPPRPAASAPREIVVSVGGGPSDLVARTAEAWSLLVARGDAPGTSLVAPTFDGDFLTRLASAALSVSHAGYNTCTNLLATGVPAVLVPHARMSDQAARADLLARLGLAIALPPDAPPARIADAMREALAAPRPRPEVPLDGAARARRAIETLAG